MTTPCRTAFAAAVFGLASLSGSASHALIVTFDNLGVLEANVGPTTVIEDYEAPEFGVGTIGDFTSAAGLIHNNLGATPDGVLYIGDSRLPGYALAPSQFLTANGNEFFRITLPSPTQVLGLDTYANGMGPVTVTFLDAAGGALDSIDFGASDGMVAAGFLGAVSSIPIAAFQWQGTFGQLVDTGLDNIRTGSLALSVPAPAPAGLLACVAVLGFVRRCRTVPAGA